MADAFTAVQAGIDHRQQAVAPECLNARLYRVGNADVFSLVRVRVREFRRWDGGTELADFTFKRDTLWLIVIFTGVAATSS